MSPPADDPATPAFPEGGPPWGQVEGAQGDVVISSRVRLARNVAGFPFMPKAAPDDRRQLLDLLRSKLIDAELSQRLLWLDLHGASASERALLAERHLISRNHAAGKLSTGKGGVDEPRGVAVSLPDELLSIMVNEEDHLRIQVMRPGLDLGGALQKAEDVDDRLNAGIEYAFSKRFGYLTACPTNVGTGLRVSVMLHLPALRLTGEIDRVKHAAQDMSLAVRGSYGEGSQAAGDFFQLSNQTTLGKSEGLLMRELAQDILPSVVGFERQKRQSLLKDSRSVLEDQTWRAFGVLTNARLLTTDESMQLLSTLRLGVVSGVVQGVSAKSIGELMLLVQPAHLQRASGRVLNQNERRVARADLIRARLGGSS